MIMVKKLINLYLLVVSCTMASSLVHAEGKSACVGRYGFNLPMDYETATTSTAMEDGQPVSGGEFQDGKLVPENTMYLNGEWSVFNMGLGKFEKIKKQAMENFLASEKNPDPIMHFEIVKLKNPNSIAWRSPRGVGFEQNLDGVEVHYSVRSDHGDTDKLVDVMRNIDMNLSVRVNTSAPSHSGVCFPGLFLKGKLPDEDRTIETTFRLKAHPDLTISFFDEGSSGKFTSKKMSEQYWIDSGLGQQIKLIGPIKYRPVKIVGRVGVQSAGKITRYDGSIDYAYLVTAAGRRDAVPDQPDLVLFILQTRKDLKNNVPVSFDEIKAIGDGILKSVYRLPES